MKSRSPHSNDIQAIAEALSLLAFQSFCVWLQLTVSVMVLVELIQKREFRAGIVWCHYLFDNNTQCHYTLCVLGTGYTVALLKTELKVFNYKASTMK